MNGFGKPDGAQSLTLEEIGRRSGVSRSTVSRVLNDHPDVRPAVRARVEAVIEETGYLPHQAARALASNRNGLIGLVMPAEVDELFGDPYYSALVNGIHLGCADHDLVFAIFPLNSHDLGSDVLSPPLAGGFVDGVIVTAGPRSDRLISSLRHQGKPIVVVGHPTVNTGLRVDVENRAGSVAAVAHLCAHGRQRVGFVGATLDYLFGVERLDGYREAMAAAGRTVDEGLIRLDHPTVDGGYRAAAALLAERPDAIYASTGPMAAGAYRALAERGLRIPDDVAIVSFDGLPRGPQLDPVLTTVVQPVVEVGRTAVQLLVGGLGQPRLVVLPTSLRLGGSCGAATLHESGS